MSGGVAYVWNKEGDFDYYCNMEMVELSLIEDSTTRKELHELIRKHYHFTGSHLASKMLDNWNKYVDEFIQIVPIEYKKVLQEEQMKKLQQKNAAARLLNGRDTYPASEERPSLCVRSHRPYKVPPTHPGRITKKRKVSV